MTIDNKTKYFINSFQQIKQSLMFYLGIVLVFLICYFSLRGLFLGNGENLSLISIFELILDLSMGKKLIIFCASVAFTASFCQDFGTQYIKFLVIRTGIKRYIYSKILICSISAFLISFIGITLFLLALWLKYPLENKGDIEFYSDLPFGEILSTFNPFVYLFVKNVVFSISIAAWSMVGLSFSAYAPNSFVAYTAPIVVSYAIESISYIFPKFLNFYLMSRSANVLNQGAVVSLSYFLFIYMLKISLLGAIFYYQVKRRIRNEIV